MLKRRIICSYPVTWYRYKTKRKHTRGFIQLIEHEGKYLFSVRDDDQSAMLPMGIIKKIIKEVESRGRYQVINAVQRSKFQMDFDNGLDSYFKLQQFKWQKSPSGKSEHYSDKYLIWMHKKHRDKMTRGEIREYDWRVKNNLFK